MTWADWQPISTAPRDRPVMLYVPRQGDSPADWIGVGHFEFAPEGRAADGYWKADNPLVSATRATHWLPMPEPPENEAPPPRPDARAAMH